MKHYTEGVYLPHHLYIADEIPSQSKCIIDKELLEREFML